MGRARFFEARRRIACNLLGHPRFQLLLILGVSQKLTHIHDFALDLLQRRQIDTASFFFDVGWAGKDIPVTFILAVQICQSILLRVEPLAELIVAVVGGLAKRHAN